MVTGSDPKGEAMAVSIQKQADALFGAVVVMEGRAKIPSFKGFEDLTAKTHPRHAQVHGKVYVALGEGAPRKIWAMFDTGAAGTAMSLGMVQLLGWEDKMSSVDSTFESAGGDAKYSGILRGVTMKVHMDLAFHFPEIMVLPNPKPHLLVGADVSHLFHPTMPWRGVSLMQGRPYWEWFSRETNQTYSLPMYQRGPRAGEDHKSLNEVFYHSPLNHLSVGYAVKDPHAIASMGRRL